MNKKPTKALTVYRTSEIKRLSKEGVSISKIAKLLGITYQLACTYKTLSDEV